MIVRVSNKVNTIKLIVTFVYGLHTISDRKELWREQKRLVVSWIPWLIMSDYNTIFYPEHRANGNQNTIQEITDGLDCIEELNLDFLKYQGQFYTWSKRGDNEQKFIPK